MVNALKRDRASMCVCYQGVHACTTGLLTSRIYRGVERGGQQNVLEERHLYLCMSSHARRAESKEEHIPTTLAIKRSCQL